MTPLRCLAPILLAAAAGFPPVLRAAEEIPRDVLQRVKGACVYVQVETARGSGSGSGFFIADKGLVITNFHVVAHASSPPRIVVNSGLPGSETYPCVVAAWDEEYDLALLRVEDPKGKRFPFLPVGKSESLAETTRVWAFGFPLGEMLDQNRNGPAISVNTGAVSALRQGDDGKLAVVQHDATVTFGNSGGPLVDARGNVIGVIVGGIPGVDINAAIPSWQILTMLQPRISKVSLNPPLLQGKGTPVAIEVEVSAPQNRPHRIWAELLAPGRPGPEKVALSDPAGKGIYKGTFSTPEVAGSPKQVLVAVKGESSGGPMKDHAMIYADRERKPLRLGFRLRKDGSLQVVVITEGEEEAAGERPGKKEKPPKGEKKPPPEPPVAIGPPAPPAPPAAVPAVPARPPAPPPPAEPPPKRPGGGAAPGAVPVKLLYALSNDHYTLDGNAVRGPGAPADPAACVVFLETPQGLKEVGRVKDRTAADGGGQADGWSVASAKFDLAEFGLASAKQIHFVIKAGEGKSTGHLCRLRIICKGKTIPERDHGTGMVGDLSPGTGSLDAWFSLE